MASDYVDVNRPPFQGVRLLAIVEEIKARIRARGRITFAEFMQACLYSPAGGFYAARRERIGAHFGTAPTSHPVFGALIARQLVEMWQLLGEPEVFHLLEVGAGDGSLARSIIETCARDAPAFTRSLRYVASDYQPYFTPAADRRIDWGIGDLSIASGSGSGALLRRVRAAGLSPFRNLVGCILSNELIDNFPVHRFVVREQTLKEICVALDGDELIEIVAEPSSAGLVARLSSLGLSLPDGYRSEVNLAIEPWSRQTAAALERGFVLTIDYGDEAAGIYSPERDQGTMVCFHRHDVRDDPYRDIGEQDITCHVDFTSLMRLGEHAGLATVGYTRQRDFLLNLGFSSCVDAIDTRGLSAARATLSKLAMMTLVDPAEYGDFKVLAQAKGVRVEGGLQGFVRAGG